jgi:RNA polymerase sigma-70 factor, ECF subfamily
VHEAISSEPRLDPEALGGITSTASIATWGLCGPARKPRISHRRRLRGVLRKPRVLRSDDDLGYLLRVLCNTFLCQRRTAARLSQMAPRADNLDLVEDKAAIRPEARIESTQLYAVMSALPEDFRDPLVAIDVVGLSYRVAERTETTRASPHPPARR